MNALALLLAAAPLVVPLEQMFAELKAKTRTLPKVTDQEAIKKLVQEMVEVDQAMRKSDRPFAIDIDEHNTAVMKKLLAKIEWFTISDWGRPTDDNAWLLVQHADRDIAFQQMVLGRLEKLVKIGETSRSHFAYLFDRVAVGTGKKQRYGTQGRFIAPGNWQPRDLEEPARVDELRAWAGIQFAPTLAEYKVRMDTHCK